VAFGDGSNPPVPDKDEGVADDEGLPDFRDLDDDVNVVDDIDTTVLTRLDADDDGMVDGDFPADDTDGDGLLDSIEDPADVGDFGGVGEPTDLPTIPSPGGVNPDDELALWVKADDPVKMTRNGDSVISWISQTPLGEIHLQGDPALQPQFNANSINYQPGLTFDGIDDRLLRQPDVIFDQTTPKKTIVVISHGNGGATYSTERANFQANAGLLFGDGAYLYQGGPNYFGGGIGQGGLTGAPVMHIGSRDTAFAKTFENGSETMRVGQGTPFGSGFNQNVIGGRLEPGVASFFGGDITEIAVYKTALTEEARRQMETYFALKYGITLTLDNPATNNYVMPDGLAAQTIVYDVTAHAGYTVTVAGIGKNFIACFDQKQSKAHGDIVAIGRGEIAETNADNPNDYTDDYLHLTWGSNGLETNETTGVGSPLGFAHVKRVWATQEDAGDNGGSFTDLDMEFDLNGTGFEVLATDELCLLVSASDDFSASACVVPVTIVDGIATFDAIDLNDAEFFTLAARDTDNDGVADVIDLDDDNDGITDAIELSYAINGGDTDGDGIDDVFDLDSDNDGINDSVEAGHGALDADNDGVVDGPYDNNGLADQIETGPESGIPTYPGNTVDPTQPLDTDGDTRPDYVDLDSDNDTLTDIVESGAGLPDPDGDGMIGDDTTLDSDDDGILDPADGDNTPLDPGDSGDADPVNTDGDPLPDYRDLDSDDDGNHDIDEAGNAHLDPDHNGLIDVTDPAAQDPDGDGIPAVSDEEPASFGGGESPDLDGDGIPDADDLDDDNDGIPDDEEAPNGDEDMDGDGIPNHHDLDSDNDGILDVIEAGHNGPDVDGNGQVDGPVGTNGLPDAVEDAPDSDVPTYPGSADPTSPRNSDNDTAPDYLDLDSDNDTLPDLIEGGSNGPDTDGDGMVDGPDQDGDGVQDPVDGDTPNYGDAGSPIAPDSEETPDCTPDYIDIDSDGDGVYDIDENGNPELDLDMDGMVDDPTDVDMDGLPDNGGDSDTGSTLGNPIVPDLDMDGIPDATDPDDDNDGIPDIEEIANAINGGDTDGDGIPDHRDLDSDNDGINDVIESDSPDPDGDGMTAPGDDTDGNGMTDFPVSDPVDTDGDTRPDYVDLDSDNDTLSDLVEGASGGLDADGDSVVDGPDSDGDGIHDSVDGSSPLFGDASSPVTPDADGDLSPDYIDVDSDDDGINDIAEAGSPELDPDGNGMIDVTDPATEDPDGDGIPEIIDTMPGTFGGAPEPDLDGDGVPDVDDLDDDNDGIPDLEETTDDADGDGIPNDRDLDSDNDGINDVVEAGHNSSDADGDGQVDGPVGENGLPDAVEDGPESGDTDYPGSADPTEPRDTDGDNAPDYLDLDSDNDTVPDLTEGGSDGPDENHDGMVDGPDSDGDGIQDPVDGDSPAFGDAASPVTPDSEQTPDGTPDYLDTDSDDDGIDDIVEAGNGDLDGDGDGSVDPTGDADGDGIDDIADNSPTDFGDPADLDLDGDGVSDVDDLDDDNDGIPDTIEEANAINGGDTDGDGIPDPRDLDSDNDGLLDVVEAGHAGDDADEDGQVDGPVGTNGLPDAVEDAPDSDVATYPENSVDPAAPVDTDGDGAPDYVDLDSDNDTISDLVEGGQGDPEVIDTDNNGVVDGPDTDGDGIQDAADDASGFGDGDSPDVPDSETTPDGTPDYLDVDSDDDGLNDIGENGNAPLDADGNGMVDDITDLDGDGLPDHTDDSDGDGDPLNEAPDMVFGGLPIPDTDGDGIPNNVDLDDDNDGIPDTVEENNATVPNGDSDGDGTPDVIDPDSDNDGIPDAIEGHDTDGDGVSDKVPAGDLSPVNGLDDACEPNGTDPLPNHDTDGLPDYLDNDDDNDGVPTSDPAENGDSDGDGTPNYLDDDDDNDGIPSVDEGSTTGEDTDGDGVPDFLDVDDDNDGVLSVVETNGDADGDGRPNHLDLDSDNDSINDVREAAPDGTVHDGDRDGMVDGPIDPATGLAASLPATGQIPENTDGDLVPDMFDLDSDNDAMSDLVENRHPNVFDTDDNGVIDQGAFTDLDTDGIQQSAEGLPADFGDANDPDPADNDSDTTPNYRDLESNNPLNDDTDYDIDDRPDSGSDIDGDGMADGPGDTDGDGIPDDTDQDPTFGGLETPFGDDDMDGLDNVEEGGGNRDTDGDVFPDSNDLDSDDDGIPDSVEGNDDVDMDGKPNYLDHDSDGDGLLDVVEGGGTDLNGDGKVDPINGAAPDPNGNGLRDAVDPTDGVGGTPLPLPDGDGDGTPDYLDVPTPFSSWQSNNGPGVGGDPSSNNDGDLFDDLCEYAFGSDPNTGIPVLLDGSGAPIPGARAGLCVEAVDGVVIATYLRPIGLADVAYQLEGNADFTNASGWSDVADVPTVTDNGDGTETLTFTGLETTLGADYNIRLRVDLTDGSAATCYDSVYSWCTTLVQGEFQTYGVSLLDKPTYAGVIESATGNVLTLPALEGGNIGDWLEAGTAYYVEITSGASQGQRFEVQESDSGTVSLDLPNARNTIAVLPDLSGASFVLRPHQTIAGVLDIDQFHAAAVASLADEIQLWDGTKFVPYYAFSLGEENVWASSPFVDDGNTVIAPGEGNFVKLFDNDAGAIEEVSLIQVGMLRTNDFVRPLNQGFNLVSGGWPLTQSAADRGMGVANGFAAGPVASIADEFQIWRGDSTPGMEGFDPFYLFNILQPNVWVDTSLTDRDGEGHFKGCRSAIYKSKDGNATFNMEVPF